MQWARKIHCVKDVQNTKQNEPRNEFIRCWKSWVGRPSSWERQHMLNELARAFGVGRLGDITHHSPVYIRGNLVENDHHSINTSSNKEFYSVWWSRTTSRTGVENLFGKSFEKSFEEVIREFIRGSCSRIHSRNSFENSFEEVIRESCSGNSFRKFIRVTWARSCGQPRWGRSVEPGEVVWRPRWGCSTELGELMWRPDWSRVGTRVNTLGE